jgi:hypothetical protein
VSHIRNTGTGAMFDYLEACARCEEMELPRGEFVATYCKKFKKQMAILSGIAIAIGGLFMFFWNVAVLFFVLGLCLFLLLPSFLSYKCLINKELIQEEYFILFFKRKKIIYWSDVKFKKVKIGGRNKSITLYNANKKRLISFDELIVGFERVIKLAKRSSIKDIKK